MWGVALAQYHLRFDLCSPSFQESMSKAKMSKEQKSQKVLAMTWEVPRWPCSVISSEQVKQQNAEVNNRDCGISRALAWTFIKY